MNSINKYHDRSIVVKERALSLVPPLRCLAESEFVPIKPRERQTRNAWNLKFMYFCAVDEIEILEYYFEYLAELSNQWAYNNTSFARYIGASQPLSSNPSERSSRRGQRAFSNNHIRMARWLLTAACIRILPCPCLPVCHSMPSRLPYPSPSSALSPPGQRTVDSGASSGDPARHLTTFALLYLTFTFCIQP